MNGQLFEAAVWVLCAAAWVLLVLSCNRLFTRKEVKPIPLQRINPDLIVVEPCQYKAFLEDRLKHYRAVSALYGPAREGREL